MGKLVRFVYVRRNAARGARVNNNLMTLGSFVIHSNFVHTYFFTQSEWNAIPSTLAVNK